MFLYSTVSTLKPIVGIVVTISPSLSLYRMVVLPAASKPTMRIRISFFEKRRLNTLWKDPMVATSHGCARSARFEPTLPRKKKGGRVLPNVTVRIKKKLVLS